MMVYQEEKKMRPVMVVEEMGRAALRRGYIAHIGARDSEGCPAKSFDRKAHGSENRCRVWFANLTRDISPCSTAILTVGVQSCQRRLRNSGIERLRKERLIGKEVSVGLVHRVKNRIC